MTQLGELSLWIALLMAAWCMTLAAQGALLRRAALVESGTRALHASLLFTTLAVIGLAWALASGDYGVRYVALYSGVNVEAYYKLCAFFAGNEGELLFAALAVSAMASAAAILLSRRGTDLPRSAWSAAMLGLIVAVLLASSGFAANPFARFPRTRGDGRGLDPLLRDPAMAIQPPLVLLGCAAATVALVLLAVAVIRRQRDRAWLAHVRAWAVAAWSLLSWALLIGAHWAYVSPGLRSLMERRPSEAAGAVAWTLLTVVLVVAALRRAPPDTGAQPAGFRGRAGRWVGVVGIVLCAIAAGGMARAKNYDVQIGDGQQYRAEDAWGHDWTFTSQGMSRLERPGDDVIALALMPARDGVRQRFITSESRQYYGAGGLDIFPAQTVPGIRSTLAQDVFVILSDAGEGRAVLRISFRPLVELGWMGGVFLALGGGLAFWPPRAEFAG